MMFGILLGTVCLMLLFMMVFGEKRRFAHAHAGGCGPRGHDGGHHGRHRRRHHWRHGPHRGHDEEDHGHDGDDRPQGDGPRRRRRGPRRDRAAWIRREAGRRLNLDDHQQDVVEVAVRQADKAVKTFTHILDESRDELADAVKGEQIDQQRLDAVFEKWDESMVEARKDLIDSLRRAHAALEPDQRRRLAEWINLAGWVR